MLYEVTYECPICGQTRRLVDTRRKYVRVVFSPVARRLGVDQDTVL